MSWWGKLLGGAFGYLLGGPLGALLGVAVGHSLDKGIKEVREDFASSFKYSDQERVQTAFFTATFSVMGHLAKVDGRVTEDEIQLAESVMSHMKLTQEQKIVAIRLFNEGKEPGFPLSSVLLQFKNECRRRRNVLRMFVEIQLHAAYADGDIQLAEKQLLLQICGQLGFSRAEFDQIEAMIRAERNFSRKQTESPSNTRLLLKDAYAVLGVSPQAGAVDIKKAYRRLLSQHHPDKLVAKGLPEEMMKIAAEKTHEIKSAYEQIREARGF